jgi:hypothetical protein
MRKIWFAAAAIFLIWSVAYPQRNPVVEPRLVSDLNKRPVIGKLGIPLGKVVEIEGTIISGTDLHTKATEGEYLLQVSKVHGNDLKAKPIMEFRYRSFLGIDVPNNEFQLKELKTGKRAAQITSKEEIEQLEKGYVGSTVKLVAYETGGFDGMPKMPKDIPVWQDHQFAFSSYLELLAKRK